MVGSPIPRPPGPRGSAMLAGALPWSAPRTQFFTDAARRYPGLAHLKVAGEHLYLVNRPDLVWALLVTNGRSTMKGRALQRAKELLGDGLLTSEGQLWRRQRRLVQPAFHRDRIRSYAQQMVQTTLEHEASWHDGDEIDVAADMSRLTLRIVGRTLFGADLQADSDEVGAAMTEVLEGFQRRMIPGADVLLRLPTAANHRLREAGERLDALVQRIIDEHRALGDTGDVLSMLLAADADGTTMSDRQVRDETMTLVLAGHETTAMALTWTWYLLSTNPSAARLLQRELSDVVGDRAPTFDDLPSLHVATAVFAEAMRLYPPAWIVGRRVTADITLDGWTLPAGSLAVASQWVQHRDPQWWDSALAFRPGRWLLADGRFDERAPGVPKGAWFPFGLGQRVCLGEPFAWAEGPLVLATLARRWAPQHLPGHAVGVVPAVTLRPRGGMPMRLRHLG
jgi:cytochrome P450